MADEKLVIEVELDTSKAEQQASALKNDMQDTGKATGESSEYAKSLAQSLTAIKNLNLGTLLTTAFTGAVKPAKELKDYITNMGSAFTGIITTRVKSLATVIKHIPELFKDSFHTFNDSTWEKLADIGKVRKTWKDFFKDTNNQLKENLGQFEEWGSKIKTIAQIVGVVLILKVMSALKKIAMQVSELGDEIDKNSQKADMGAEKYQQWTYIFDRCGLSADDLNTSMKMLQRNVANTVAQGKYAGSAYEKLGFSMEEISNLKSDELFERTVQKLQQVGNQAERTALAYEVFGRNATQLNTILNASNADVERLKRTYDILGAKMSNDLVKASARLQDAMTDLKNAGQGLKNVVGQALIPSITKLVHWLAKAIAYVTMFIRAINGFKSTGRTTEKNTASMGGYTKAVDSATKAVEKLKRSQLGFDEMNILPGQDSGTGDLGSAIEDMDFGGIGDLGESLFTDEELAKMEKFQEKMDRLAEKMRYITPIALTLGGALMIVVGLMTGNILMVIGGIALCALGIAVGDSNGLWDELTEKFQQNADKITDICFTVAMALGLVLGLVTGNIPLAIVCGVGLIAGIGAIGSDFGWWDKASQILKEKGMLITDICVMVASALGLVISLMTGNIPLAVACAVGLIAGFVGLGSDLGWWDQLLDGLKAFWDRVKSWFNSHIKKIFTKEFWKQKWDNIVQGFKDGINNLITKIENGINNIINKINNSGLVTTMNKLFNWNIHIEPISIKRLATGGIIDKPTLSMIGENGKEAVVPLENNTQWMDKLADRLTSKNPTKLVLMVDGKELGYATIDNINAITKQTGSLQLKLA